MTDEQTPTPGQPLSEADVSLLQPGDWLRLADGYHGGFARHASGDSLVVEVDPATDTITLRPTSGGIDYFSFATMEGLFKFVDRPHAPVSRPGDGVEGVRSLSLEDAAELHRQAAVRAKVLAPRNEWWRYSSDADPVRSAAWALIEHFERVDADERSKAVIASAVKALSTTPAAEPLGWRYRTKNSVGQWSMWVVTSEEPSSDVYEYEAVPLYPALTPPAEPVSRPAGEGEREAVDLWYPVKNAIARSMMDERDGKPCGCIIEAGCEARGYHDPAYAADGFMVSATDAILALLSPAAPDAGGGVTFDGDDMVAVADALKPWMKNYPPSTRRERCVEAANAVLTAFCARKQPALQPGGER